MIFCILVYWVAARGWQLRYRFPDLRERGEIDPGFFRLEGGLESRFLRGAAVVLLLALAVRFLPGPLRDGLQRARQLPGGHRLRGPEHRAAAAVAGDLRLPRGRRVRLDAAAGSSPASHGAGPGGRISSSRALVSRALCAAQRDLARSGPTSRPTSTPPAAPSASNRRSRKSNSRPSPKRRSTRPRTSPARQRAPVGHGARSTTPSRRSRRCALLRLRTTPTWTATRSTASTGRCCSRRASWISANSRRARQLDQPGVHLHPRLRRWCCRGQPDHAGRPARAADRKRAARDQDQEPQAHAARDLLRRGDARAGIRPHGAARSSTIPRGEQNVYLAVRRQGRISGLVASPCGWPPPSTKASPTSC